MTHRPDFSRLAVDDDEVTPLEAPTAIMILREVQANVRDMRAELGEAVGHMLAVDAQVSALAVRVSGIEDRLRSQANRTLALIVAIVPVLIGSVIAWAMGWLRAVGGPR